VPPDRNDTKAKELPRKQALAAIGQAELIKIYQKFFEESNQLVAQRITDKRCGFNSSTEPKCQKNTYEVAAIWELFPIINENDTIATYEIEFGDNDTLSAIVSRPD